MNKSKRNDKGQYARDRTPKRVAFSWIMAGLSTALLYVTGQAVLATTGSFRSCSVNNTGLFVRNCGKTSPGFGDVVIVVVFIAAAAMTVSTVTTALRITKRKPLV
jgi:hypothetical protein